MEGAGVRFERFELEVLLAALDAELRRREQRLRSPVPQGWIEYRVLERRRTEGA
jgi:hypothetical protein